MLLPPPLLLWLPCLNVCHMGVPQGWCNYEMALELLGGVPVHYALTADNGWLPDPATVEAAITPRTKVLLINSPGNPTGVCCDIERLEALLAVAERHGLFVLSDEIYADIMLGVEGQGGAAAAGRRAPSVFDVAGYDERQVMVVAGASKAFAMTGFRVGWLVAHPEVAAVAMKLQEPFVSCGSAFSQHAVVAALRAQQRSQGAGKECGASAQLLAAEFEGMRSAYAARRDAAVEVLRRRGRWQYSPNAAFYLLVDVRDCLGTDGCDEAFAKDLLAEKAVAVAPGSAFGTAGRGFVRVALAASEEDVVTGVERLCDFADERSKL